MENVGHAQNLRGFKNSAGEEGEALGVVGIVAGRSAIEGIAIKKFRILDKIEANTGLAASGNNRRETILVVKWDRDAAGDGRWLGEFGLAIARQVDGYLMEERAEGIRRPGRKVG